MALIWFSFVGQPHEGSIYASQKVLQMAWHRLEHVRSRLNELEKNKLRIQARAAQRPQMTGQHQEIVTQQVNQ